MFKGLNKTVANKMTKLRSADMKNADIFEAKLRFFSGMLKQMYA